MNPAHDAAQGATTGSAAAPSGDRPIVAWLIAAALAVFILIVYVRTLHPGVGDGDAAELQYMSALLGICHPPGYPFVVIAGKLFSFLPIGESIAWRINLMMALCGTAACLLVYATMLRITGRVAASAVSALILAFSSIYWQNALLAEVYAFYMLFLTGALYAAVRFVQTDRAGWLCASALLMGVCVGNRPSELLVLPAFVAMWLLWWRQKRSGKLSPRRIGIVLALGVLPFCFTVVYYFAREDPRLLHARDDALRDAVLPEETPFDQLSFPGKVREALLYSLALKWTGRADLSWERLAWNVDKYAWMVSGVAAFGDRFAEDDTENWRRRIEQNTGTNLGAPALLLAALGIWFWRSRPQWIALGGLMWLGNFAFYLYHSPPDHMEFVSPGLLGMAVLAGLGVAGPPRPSGSSQFWRNVWPAACLLAPVSLLVTNYAKVNKADEAQLERQARLVEMRDAPLPADSVVISGYMPTMTMRYVYYIEAQRTDVNFLIFRTRFGTDELRTLMNHFAAQDRPVFVYADLVPDSLKPRFANQTPPALVRYGFYRMIP